MAMRLSNKVLFGFMGALCVVAVLVSLFLAHKRGQTTFKLNNYSWANDGDIISVQNPTEPVPTATFAEFQSGLYYFHMRETSSGEKEFGITAVKNTPPTRWHPWSEPMRNQCLANVNNANSANADLLPGRRFFNKFSVKSHLTPYSD